MKKLIVLLALLLAALPTAGQTVGASQIKRKTNAGLVADSVNALSVGIYRGTSGPASPVTGQLWLDTTTTPATLKTYNGSTWEAPPTAAAITQTDLTSFPANPTDGQILWVTSLKRALIYDDSDSKWYFLDALGRAATASYSLEVAGYSSSFLPAAGATTGTAASGGSMTAGTHVCAVTYYNSVGGETEPGATSASMTIGGSNYTASLSFTAGGTGVRGKRVWCSKANQTTPLWLVTTIDDATTGTYDVTVADSSFIGHTAPDVDFSAPIPSGWSVYLPDATFGGCGSTGTSLVCVTYKKDTYGISMSGPRLLYEVTGEPSGWRATWKVTRALPGFPNSTALADQNHSWAAIVSSDTLAAPVGFGLGNYAPSGGWSLLPLSSGSAAQMGTASRALSAVWGAISSGSQNIPPIIIPPFWVQATHINADPNFAYMFATSGDGVLYTTAYPYPTGGSSTATLCTSAFCTTTLLPFVGPVVEWYGNTGTGQRGILLEIKEFTLTTW